MDRCFFSPVCKQIAALGALIVAVAALDSNLAAIASAEGFRIATKIFVGKEKEPVSTATTLFLNGTVYDFLSEPEQIAVFHKSPGDKPGRFILLDPDRRVRTEFSTDKVNGAMEKLNKWASQQKDPVLKFAADPKFDEKFDKESGQIVLRRKKKNPKNTGEKKTGGGLWIFFVFFFVLKT